MVECERIRKIQSAVKHTLKKPESRHIIYQFISYNCDVWSLRVKKGVKD